MIYYSLFFLLMLYSFFSFLKVKRDVINLEIIVVCLVGIILTGFRDGVGNDYQNYVNIYNNTQSFGLSDFSGQVEPGFNLLICILKLFNLPPQSLFIVTSFFIVIGLVDITKKYDITFFPLIILFVYARLFFYLNFNILRQALASVLIYYGLNKRTAKKRLLYIFISLFFHVSAIFVLPLAFLIDIKNKKMIKFAIILSIFGVLINFNGFIEMKMVSIFLNIPKFYLYQNNFSTASTIFALKSLYLKYFCIYYLLKLKDNDETSRRLLIIQIYSMYIFILTFIFGEIFNRLMLYFEIYMIFSYIKVIKYNKGKLINFIFVPFLYYYYFSAMRTFITRWEYWLLPFKFYSLI